MDTQHATPLPLVPFGARSFLDAIGVHGRMSVKLALPVDIRRAVDGNQDFWTYVEKPLSGRVVQEAIEAHVAARIRAGDLDAADGPVITTGTIYRHNGQLFPLRPSVARGEVVEQLSAVSVRTQTSARALFTDDVRHLISFPVPAAWSKAEQDRASKAEKSADALPAPQNAIGDVAYSALVLEPLFASSDPDETPGEPFPDVNATADAVATSQNA